MHSFLVSKKQEALFKEISRCGELILSCGVPGCSAHIVGNLRIERNEDKREDQVTTGDGTHHLHVDWNRVKRMESGHFPGGGMLTFFDGKDLLFRILRDEADFPKAVTQFEGNLLDSSE